MVDGSDQVPLVERWNGRHWSIQHTPSRSDTVGSYLASVSCASSRACIAVGQYSTSGPSGRSIILVERWNGRRWSLQSAPLPDTAESQLSGVSCASPTACTAVGSFDVGYHGFTALAERWNGKRWSRQPHAAPNTTDLTGVSCATTTTCIAVGYGSAIIDSHPPVEAAWGDKRWTMLTPPSGGAGPLGVSCASSTACTGVGVGTIDRWNGKKWSSHPVGILKAFNSEWPGVSCASVTVCTIVGASSNKFGIYRPLAVRWNDG
jgi:hypothetical protein